MKVFDKGFLAEQTKENSVIATLVADCAPLLLQLESKKAEYEKIVSEYSLNIASLINKEELDISSKLDVRFESDTVEFHINENQENYGSHVNIEFICKLEDYWDKDEKKKWKLGAIKEISHSTYSTVEPDDIEGIDYLLLIGWVALKVKNKSEFISTISSAIMHIHSLDSEIKNISTKISELNSQIFNERKAIISSEIEMRFRAGNCLIRIIKQEPSDSYSRNRRHKGDVIYSLNESEVLIIDKIATKTCAVRTYDLRNYKGNGGWSLSYERVKLREDMNYTISNFAKNVTKDDDIIIALDAEETQAFLSKNKKDDLDKKAKDFISKIEEMCVFYSAEEEQICAGKAEVEDNV